MAEDYKKYCPLIRRECLRDRCEWWNNGQKEEYARCVVADINSLGFKLFRIMQMMEQGTVGAGGSFGGGGGFSNGNGSSFTGKKRDEDPFADDKFLGDEPFDDL